MFEGLKETFRKIRTLIGAVRNGILGLMLVIAGWLFLAPPTQTEIAAMALPQDATADNIMLRAHRMAKLLKMIESDRLYAFIADSGNTSMSAKDLAAQIDYAAEGIGAYGPAATPVGADAMQKAFVDGSGAKFVPARTN